MSRAHLATLLTVYLALMALLGATIGTSYLELGAANVVLNLSIAVAKTALVAWFFMHLRETSGLVRLFAAAGAFWLAMLFALGLADWLTR